MDTSSQISWPTIITLLISSIVAPLLADKGFDLTQPQEASIATWVISAFTALLTIGAHLIHAKVKAAA